MLFYVKFKVIDAPGAPHAAAATLVSIGTAREPTNSQSQIASVHGPSQRVMARERMNPGGSENEGMNEDVN
ncbi:MAG TPA: hypothetical protein VMC42_07905 [Methanoregulaceae archaeon]|nr:hypothetical protein [Methanoregulaceae archaeon]